MHWAMAMGKRKEKQRYSWLETTHLQAPGRHPFYRRVNAILILDQARFDYHLERICRKYYAAVMGRHRWRRVDTFVASSSATLRGPVQSAARRAGIVEWEEPGRGCHDVGS
jgi:hypothetical protein